MVQMSNDHVRCVQKDHVANKKKKKLYDKYIYPKELSKIVLFPQIYEYFFIDTSTGIYKIKSILPALKTNKWPLEIGICLLCSEVHSRWFQTDWERALKSKAGVCSAPFLLFAARAGQERCTGVEKMCGSTQVGDTSVHTSRSGAINTSQGQLKHLPETRGARQGLASCLQTAKAWWGASQALQTTLYSSSDDQGTGWSCSTSILLLPSWWTHDFSHYCLVHQPQSPGRKSRPACSVKGFYRKK